MFIYIIEICKNAFTSMLTLFVMICLARFIMACIDGIANCFERPAKHIIKEHPTFVAEKEYPKETVGCTVVNGTKMRPKERQCESANESDESSFYITLCEDCYVEIKSLSVVTLDGVKYRVVPEGYDDNDIFFPILNSLSSCNVVIPEGYEYVVNDPTKDSIGLTKVFETYTEFVLASNSEIILDAGTTLVTSGGKELRLVKATTVMI